MNLEDFRLASVDEVSQELLDAFDCGDDELNGFLRSDSVQYGRYGLTHTTAVFREECSTLVGFFSLSCDSLKLAGVELSELGLPFDASLDFFPAVKVTKLAVASGWQSQGIGRHMLAFIQGIAFRPPLSARLLTVNAVNRDRALSFYEREGFIVSSRHHAQEGQRRKGVEPATVLMYRDLYADS